MREELYQKYKKVKNMNKITKQEKSATFNDEQDRCIKTKREHSRPKT